MPNTESHSVENTYPFFISKLPSTALQKLPLDVLQKLSVGADSATREAAIRTIFALTDEKSLYFQKSLMMYWLESSIKPPLDMNSLNTALKRIKGSLDYKFLCLLLIHQLNNVTPEIDITELLIYIDHGLRSQDQPKMIAVLQALPTVLAIAKASKGKGETWQVIINSYIAHFKNISEHLLDKKAGEISVKPGHQGGLIAEEINKSLSSLYENSKQLDFFDVAYLFSVQYLLNPGASSMYLARQVFISCLKKPNMDFTKLMPLLKEAIFQESISLSNSNSNSKILLTRYWNALGNPEEKSKLTNKLIAGVIRCYLPDIMPVLLSLSRFKNNKLDKLINRIISESFKVGQDEQLQAHYLNILDNSLPELSKKQLGEVFAEIQSTTEYLQEELVIQLSNLFTLPELTQQQFDYLAELVKDIDVSFVTEGNFFYNFIQLIPGVSTEQKNKLQDQVKVICTNQKFWDIAASCDYLPWLRSNDFVEVFNAVYSYDGDIENIFLMLPPLLTAPQITREQFESLIEKFDKYLCDENLWSDDFAEECGEIPLVLSHIFQSSYLSESQYAKWFIRLSELMKKNAGYVLDMLPALLNSKYFTTEQGEIVTNWVLYNMELPEGDEKKYAVNSSTLNAIFALPKIIPEQFVSLLNAILQQKPDLQILLESTPAIMKVAKSKATVENKIEDQAYILLKKAISEIGKNTCFDERGLKDFLYNDVVIAKLAHNYHALEALVEALSKRDNFSAELQNFLCHLVISGKITSDQLENFNTNYSLGKTGSIFIELYNRSQQLMQNMKPNTTQSNKEDPKRHTLFGAADNNQENKEKKEEEGRPKKKARGLG
ncbi:hypothetical protein [Legionella fairfieldensis]|uniref:hypothetical protein n=1 Tax=Legionella fairfieldensis TaxID=45064 RepID=UPI00048D2102|nr:hypothetical protein [Legionella fairfieldensis]